MAITTVSMELKLKATDIEKANKEAASLRANAEATNKAYSTIKVPITSSTIAKAAAVPGSTAIQKSGTGESKTARSIGASGGTGSASSDFAAQASGLGGLVHVYATFAANIFAVSAAFTALSKAMDVTNLVAGLDQIGAASGKNLGSIAKQMVKVTDGAIALRQAMSSTAMASSSGMTNTQILRMAKVAQQASLALGRDIPDSMERLTKGIVKSQPELLDELGIMTRMIPAQQAYAEKIGKTTTALTTFEKQQAFANAVLEEGERKFKEIELSSNPYSKILASIQNLMQNGLEALNKKLTPIVEIFASSPTALATAIGLLAFSLLKQALPAIGMFKERMKDMAETSKNLAISKALEAQKGYKSEAIAAKQAAVNMASIELEKAKNTEALAKETAAKTLAITRQNSALAKANAREEYNSAKQAAEALVEPKVTALIQAEKKVRELVGKGLDSKKPSAAIKLMKIDDVNDITSSQLSKITSVANGLETKAIKANMAIKEDQAKLAATTNAEEIKGLNTSIAKNEALYQSYKKSSVVQREYVEAVVAVKNAHLDYEKTMTASEALKTRTASAANNNVIKASEQEALAAKNAAKATADAIAFRTDAENKLAQASKALYDNKLKEENLASTGRQAQMNADRAILKSKADSIVAQSSQTASVKGFSAAMTEAWSDVKKAMAGPSEEIMKIGTHIDDMGKKQDTMAKVTIPAMGKMQASWTMLKSSVVAGVGAITTALNAFQSIFIYVGIAVAVFQVVNDYMTTSAKQTEAFSSSLDTLKSSMDNVDRTIEHISKKDFKDILSIESIQAKANAFVDLVESLDSVIKKFEELKKAQNSFDKNVDWVKNLFGKGDADKLSANLADTLVSSLKVMREGPAKEAFTKSIKELLGTKVDFSSSKSIINAINPDIIGDTEKIKELAVAIDKLLITASNANGSAAASLTSLKTALDDINKQSLTMTNKLIPTDDFSKLGIMVMKMSTDLEEAFKNPEDRLVSLVALSKDIKTLSLIPSGDAKKLAKMSEELEGYTTTIAILEEKLTKSKNDKVKWTEDSTKIGTSGSANGIARESAKEALKTADKVTSLIQKSLDNTRNVAKEAIKDFNNLPKTFAQVAFDNLAKGLKQAMQEASIIQQKGILDISKSAGINVSVEESKLAGKELDIQAQAVKQNFTMIMAQTSLEQAVKENNLTTDRNTLSIEKLALTNAKEANNRGIEAFKASKLGDPTTLMQDNTLIEAKLKELAKKEVDLKISQEKFDATKKKLGTLDSEGGNASKILMKATSKGALDSNDPSIKQAAELLKELPALAQALMGMQQQLGKIAAQKFVVNMQQDIAEKEKTFIETGKKLVSEKASLDSKATELSMLGSISIYYDKQIEQAKLDNSLALEKTNLEITLNKLAQDRVRIDAARKFNPAAAEKEMSRSLATEADARQANYAKTEEIKNNSIANMQKGEESLRKLREDNSLQERRDANSIAQIYLDADTTRINRLVTIGAMKKSDSIDILANIELIKIQNDYEIKSLEAKKAGIESIQRAQDELKRVQDSNASRLQAVDPTNESARHGMPSPVVVKDTTEEETQLKNAQSALERNLSILTTTRDIAKDKVLIDAEDVKMLELQNEAMAKMESLAYSIEGAFSGMASAMGDAGKGFERFGSGLAKVVTTSAKIAKTDQDNAKKKLAAEDNLNSIKRENSKLGLKTSKEQVTAEKALEKIKTKTITDELDGNAEILGSAKQMFGEKTAAYKTLNAMETGFHIASMTMKAIELAADIANGSTRMGIMIAQFLKSGTLALSESLTIPPPFSFIAFGLTAALLASIGNPAGSGASAPAGFSAEDMQQSQGTGQSWVDGKLVENGGGVFGDPTAKSESIQNSLDLLNDNQIDGLSFASEQTRLLEKINQGIEGVAIAAYGVQGIRTGSGFGTIESSTSNPGLLGLFASSKSTEIINAGIKMTGTFKSLGIAGDGLIQQFETVKSTSTNSGIFGLFSSNKTSIKDNVKPLETKAETAIREVFGYMGELLVDSGDRLGLTAVDALNRINGLTVDITASLQGLTGKETQEELNAIFSSILDDAYTELAPHLSKFKKFGEGMAQTVVRVIDGFDKVNLSFKLMGLGSIKFTETMGVASQELYDNQSAALAELTAAKAAVPEYKTTVLYDEGISVTNNQKEVDTANEKVTASTLKYTEATDAINDVIQNTTTKGYELSEALIDAAGGLDKFIESAQLFSDRFLTEAERAAALGDGMFTKLNSLGASNKVLKEVGVTVGPSDPYEETNGFAVKMFQTFSDGNDSIIDTAEEYKNLVQGVQAIAIAEGTSAEDRTAAVALFAELTESNLMEAFANIADAYAEAFDSPMDTLLKAKKGLVKEFDTLGQIGITASQPIGLLDRQMKAVGISSINSKDSFTRLMNSLTGTDAETVRLRNGLMTLGPAFASIADEVSSLVTEVSDSVSSSIRSMRMDTLDEAGKYAMIDSEGADSKAAMLAAESIYDIAEAANATIDSLNSAWSLLTEDQKKSQLNWYTNELQSIDDYVKDKGADATSIRQAENEELATSIATASADTLAPVVTTLESVAGSLDTIASTLTGTVPKAAIDTNTNTSYTANSTSSIGEDISGIVNSLSKTLETITTGSVEQSKQLIAEIASLGSTIADSTADKSLTEAITALNSNVTKQMEVELSAEDTSKDSIAASIELLSTGALEQSNLLVSEVSTLTNSLLATITTLSDKDVNTALTDAVAALSANISNNANITPDQAMLDAISARKQEEQKQMSDMLSNTIKASLDAIGINLSTAAGNMKAAADKPVQVAITLNVTKTAGTEVGIG